jgi:D-xylose transport system substrate-binding protein
VYVSFDNVEVGKMIGQGLVDCISAWKVNKPNVLVMNGDPTDNNASLFSQGYHEVLDPKFKDGTYVKTGEPAGTWTPSKAQTTFDQQLTAHPSTNAVVTPNDDNANAVIASLQRQNTKPKTFPTTGQDASLSGLQNILKGFQCGTVYKPIYKEAQAAAAVALYMRAGETPPSGLVSGKVTDPSNKKDVASVLLTPTWVTTDNMNDTVVKDEAVKVSDLCIPAVASACTAAGIT